MPFEIIRENLARVRCDAVINAASHNLMGGSGADQALHDAAGPAFEEECRKIGHCQSGEAVVTGGGNLPCRYVIHTPGPWWRGGSFHEEETLRKCYRNSFDAALKLHCERIAFPLLGSGSRGFPKELALQVATEEINRFLEKHSVTLVLVVYDPDTVLVTRQRKLEIKDYLERNFFPPQPVLASRAIREEESFCFNSEFESEFEESSPKALSERVCYSCVPSLADRIADLDASFSETVLKLIAQKGITEKECYTRANMDRRLFSKIRKGDYHPNKTTALSLVLALHLNLEETEKLLKKAGYALSDSSKTDVIVKYFIENQNYNLFDINAVLFDFDQPLIGNLG